MSFSKKSLFCYGTKSTLDVHQYASRVDVCPFQPFSPIPCDVFRGCKETRVSLHPLKISQGIGKNGWNGQTSTRARQSRLKRKNLSLALTGVLLGVLVYVEGGFCLFSKFASEFGAFGASHPLRGSVRSKKEIFWKNSIS